MDSSLLQVVFPSALVGRRRLEPLGMRQFESITIIAGQQELLRTGRYFVPSAKLYVAVMPLSCAMPATSSPASSMGAGHRMSIRVATARTSPAARATRPGGPQFESPTNEPSGFHF